MCYDKYHINTAVDIFKKINIYADRSFTYLPIMKLNGQDKGNKEILFILVYVRICFTVYGL